MRRRYVFGAIGGAVAAGIAFAVGVESWRPVLIGVVVAAGLAWARRLWPEGIYLPWPLPGTRIQGGGSYQVARLAGVIGQRVRGNVADPGLQYRLRRLADQRLRRLGVSWGDPQASALLGPTVYTALTAEAFTPRLRDVEEIVTAIERLGDSPPSRDRTDARDRSDAGEPA